MGALEGANALAKGYFMTLSEQNIIDCSGENNNYKIVIIHILYMRALEFYSLLL